MRRDRYGYVNERLTAVRSKRVNLWVCALLVVGTHFDNESFCIRCVDANQKCSANSYGRVSWSIFYECEPVASCCSNISHSLFLFPCVPSEWFYDLSRFHSTKNRNSLFHPFFVNVDVVYIFKWKYIYSLSFSIRRDTLAIVLRTLLIHHMFADFYRGLYIFPERAQKKTSENCRRRKREKNVTMTTPVVGPLGRIEKNSRIESHGKRRCARAWICQYLNDSYVVRSCTQLQFRFGRTRIFFLPQQANIGPFDVAICIYAD